MTARWLNIARKHRCPFGLHANLADFTLQGAETASPTSVLHNPALSLYCLDNERREAIFVELPASVRLTDAAFVHMRQYEEAVRVFALPYSDFLRLAAELPAVDRFIMVYNTGRCGSTLLSHAFNRLAGVASLSEPDEPVGFVHFQRRRAMPPEEMRTLFDASIRFLFRQPDNSMPTVCALKLRSESIQLAGLIEANFPHAKNLFLYRDAVGWVGSMYRIFMRLQLPERQTTSELRDKFDRMYGLDADRLLPHLGEIGAGVSTVEFLTLLWLGVVETYIAATERGLPVTALRYEDLTQRPQAVLEKVFELCDLNDADARGALAAYEKDSQAGTLLARARVGEEHWQLSAEQVETIEAILARHPAIKEPSMALPRTLEVA
jgi:hypothetical protein